MCELSWKQVSVAEMQVKRKGAMVREKLWAGFESRVRQLVGHSGWSLWMIWADQLVASVALV